MEQYAKCKIVDAVYHKPQNFLKEIKEIYAYVSVDEHGEGIISQTIQMEGGLIQMPFIGAGKDRLHSLRPLAEQIAKDSGVKIRLIKLTTREVIEDIS